MGRGVRTWAEGGGGGRRGYFRETVLADGGMAVADLVTVAWMFT